MPPAPGSASEAMARYAQGDEHAFGELYDALAPRLHAYLRRYVRSDATAEDLLQQVFLKFHLGRARFLPGAPVEPWAFAIARGVAIDHLRREQRRKSDELKDDVPGEGGEADADAGARELSAAVERELEGMSPRLREAFLLVRLDGLSHAEAAQVLGIEETATKVRTHRATNWLRDRLAHFFHDEEPE